MVVDHNKSFTISIGQFLLICVGFGQQCILGWPYKANKKISTVTCQQEVLWR